MIGIFSGKISDSNSRKLVYLAPLIWRLRSSTLARAHVRTSRSSRVGLGIGVGVAIVTLAFVFFSVKCLV